jgi:chromosome partitioning protein
MLTMSYALVNLKPGVGKTTSAVFLCAALADAGYKPLLVDADPGASALSWSDAADGLGYPVIGLAVADLHRRLPDVIPAGVDSVVIDVPQIEDHARIARGAMRYARHWVIPVAPSGIEIDRMMVRVAAEMDDVQSLRADLADASVLLTRTNRATPTKTGPDADVRRALTSRGYEVLTTMIPHSDGLYRQCFGTRVDPRGTAYATLLDELLARREA